MVKISVIVPCYNVEEYLQECLDSIVNQTFRDIEIICIDDGSTDDTLKILKSYKSKDNRIKIISQENKGLSASRNVGIETASGDYICFIDSDDYFKLTAFEEAYEIASEKSLDFLMFKIINFDDETKKEKSVRYFDMKKLKATVGDNVFDYHKISKIVFEQSVTAPGKLFNREFIKDMRFPECLIFEDNAFYAEAIFKAKRVYFYDEYLYFRRIRESSITHSSTDRFLECIEVFNQVVDTTKELTTNPFYKRRALNFKIKGIYRKFTRVNEEDKAEFFKKIKMDALQYKDEYYFDEEFQYLDERAQFIFKASLESENHEEYDYSIRNNDLILSNRKFKRRNRKLKKEINRIDKFNNVVFNSTSWEITKPFRKITDIFTRS